MLIPDGSEQVRNGAKFLVDIHLLQVSLRQAFRIITVGIIRTDEQFLTAPNDTFVLYLRPLLVVVTKRQLVLPGFCDPSNDIDTDQDVGHLARGQ